MAGLYLHIPFCRNRCVYCDFCSTTLGRKTQQAYVDALLQEMQVRCDYLEKADIDTVYLGGGTPSVLADTELQQVFDAIHTCFTVSTDAEITMEANPDDIEPLRVRNWIDMGVNRLSMGVQSFDDDLLSILQRRHTAQQAKQAVVDAYEAGLKNISIDLMYGLPMLSTEMWKQTLTEALVLPVTHVSAYCLSVEQQTPLAALVEEGKLHIPDDDVCEMQYRSLVREMRKAGFRHYEISNFALPGMHSRHNASYWDGTPYLGLGAGAHSFNGTTRRANTSDVQAYIHANGNAPCETETLNRHEQMNEAVFLSLRTSTGLQFGLFRERFGEKALQHVLQQARPHILAGRLAQDVNALRLTEQGVFVSNDVISDLLIVD